MAGEILRDTVTPCVANDHPEEDNTKILDKEKHREYQSLIGMAQWLVTPGRLNICYAISSLSRFCSSPREGHYKRVLRLWGYLQKYPDKSICFDARKPMYNIKEFEQLKPDFEDQYRYASEEIDPRFPEALHKELVVSIFFDSNHGHDKVTGMSISGKLVMIGRTPLIWKSKR